MYTPLGIRPAMYINSLNKHKNIKQIGKYGKSNQQEIVPTKNNKMK